MRRILLVALLVLVVAGLVAAGCTPAPAPAPSSPSQTPTPSPAPAPKGDAVVIKGISHLPLNHYENRPVVYWVDKCNQRLNGEVVLEFLGGPEVFPELDQAEALRTGAIDALFHTAMGKVQSLIPEAWAAALSQYTAWEDKDNGVRDHWRARWQEQINAYYLGSFTSIQTFNFYTKDRINSMNDFAGMTIRVQPQYIPFVEALDAAAITMAAPDIYTAMERGTIDAYMWPQRGITGFALEEVTKYEINPGVMQIETASAIGMEKWNELTPEQQFILQDAFDDLEYIATAMRWNELNIEWGKMAAAGMEQISLPKAEGDAFVKLAYEKTWEEVTKMAPDIAPQLREMMTK